jgi:hypothetical protein
MSVIAMLAVESVSTSGVLVRMMPFERAYGTSRLLYPTATFEMTFKSAPASTTSLSILSSAATTSACFPFHAADEIVLGEHAVPVHVDVTDRRERLDRGRRQLVRHKDGMLRHG